VRAGPVKTKLTETDKEVTVGPVKTKLTEIIWERHCKTFVLKLSKVHCSIEAQILSTNSC
jgi:hypothetical protein